jgi:hypothetical protein
MFKEADMTARIALALCAALLLATVPATRSEAQPGGLPATRHAEFLNDPGYRAAYAVFESLGTAARNRVPQARSYHARTAQSSLPKAGARLDEWTEGLKMASLKLGMALGDRMPSSGNAEYQGFYRLLEGDHVGGQRAGDEYEGEMAVVAVGEGPRGPEYGVMVTTVRNKVGAICEFDGLGGFPRGGRMIFRFEDVVDGSRREVEAVFRGNSAMFGPQGAIASYGGCGAGGIAAGEYRRTR